MRFLRFAVVLLSLFGSTAWALPAIYISALQGDVIIQHEGKEIVPRVESPIAIGDHVVVGDEGWATLRFSDGGSFTVRSGSDFSVDRYRYSGKTLKPKDGLFATLFKGSMRAISGLVSKNNAPNYAIRTPTATIGVRGTDYDVAVVTETDEEGNEPGTYTSVHDGETVLQTQKGEVRVRKGESGSALLADALPRVLNRLPGLLEKLQKEDLRNGIGDHLKLIHHLLDDGSFKNSLNNIQEIRDLQGKANTDDGRKQILNKVLDLFNR